MIRNILVLGLGSLLLAACASSPSGLTSEELISTVTASPAPPPEGMEADDMDELAELMGEPVGDTSSGEIVLHGTGRGGGMQRPEGNIELDLSGIGAGGGGSGEGTIGIGNMGAIGSGGGGSAGSGFIYPAMGSAFATARPETPYAMQANGEAPYWRSDAEFYELDGEILARFSLVAADAGELGVTLREAPGNLVDGFRSYVSVDADGPRVSANYQAGPCVDALGVEREYFASIQVDGSIFEGCARETGGQWDWSRDLLSRYTEILVCLEEVENAIGVLDAYAPSPENTAIRVLTVDQSRFECLIVNSGQRLASVRELDATEVHLNEGRTIFMRERFQSADNCRSYESIRSATGELMGYLAHDLCQNPRVHVEGPLEPGES
ncbi:hypothetical protein V0U79_01875 [Hyphobacterium sp. HN65]|uniref:Uncharacterized protein n=1 Tax=Hyphobacterium lacteum TaxID=3116575 RepID=A0ABU7LMF3_9PROT|nr:hypothetical protein [Hyphobacterium sp. HN65]MEE2525096.1 hypothetical protein [Hyphobacterium sp. HN65]